MSGTNGKIVVIYHENWLLRKESVTQWIDYWGVIRGKWLQFYEKTENNRPELRKTLEITPNTKCSLVKRNKKRYPFSVDNGNGVYYLKVETELERYHWIFSILTAALGRPKKPLPTVVPESMKETETFRKLTKTEKQEIRDKRPPPPKKEHVPAAEIKNKRRRKFAVRRENKIKKKERARMKKLGLDPDQVESDESEDEHSEDKAPVKVSRPAGNENRLSSENSTTNLRQQPQRNKQTLETRERQREQVLGSSPAVIKASGLNKEEVTIKAMVHPPSSGKNKDAFYYANQAFVDDEMEELPKVPVILDDDGLLPNMVFTEVSDSESDEATTEEISLNSQTDFLSLAESESLPVDSLTGMNDSTQSGGRRVSSATITSRTVLSDNGDVVQFSASPDMSKNRSNKQRPNSAHISPDALLERPISPLLAKPLIPYKKTTSRPASPNNLMETNSNNKDFSTFLDATSTV